MIGFPKALQVLVFFPGRRLGRAQKKEIKPIPAPFIQKFTHTTNLFAVPHDQHGVPHRPKQEQNAETRSCQGLPALERIVDRSNWPPAPARGTAPSPGIADGFSSAGHNSPMTRQAEQRLPTRQRNRFYVTFAHGRIYLVTGKTRTES